MTSTYFEVVRNYYDEIELLERTMLLIFCSIDKNVSYILNVKKKNTEEIILEKMLLLVSSRISYLSDLLTRTYCNEKNSNLNTELDVLSGFISYKIDLKENPDVIKNFYNMIEDSLAIDRVLLNEQMKKNTPEFFFHYYYDVATREIGFNSKEIREERIDLSNCYECFFNFTSVSDQKTKITYIDYLKSFWEFDFNIEMKKSLKYKNYLNNLEKEFFSYYIKSKPLIDIVEILSNINIQFENFKGNIQSETISGIDISILQVIASFWINQFSIVKKNVFKHESYLCEVCCKVFNCEKSYNQHLNGKLHSKKLSSTNSMSIKEISIEVSKIIYIIP